MAKRKTPLTIKSLSPEPTSDKNLFKVVRRDKNWTHYYLKKQKRYVPSVNYVLSIGFPKGKRFYEWLKNASPEEANRKLETSGEEGTRTHQAIRDLIDGATIHLATKYYNELTGRQEALSNDEWDNLQAFTDWWHKYKAKKILHEFSIANEELGYAGTPDFIGTIKIPDGDKCIDKEFWGKEILVLLDWKTSSSIWDEYKLQTAAYREAVRLKLMSKYGLDEKGEFFTGVVRVGTAHKCGYEMELWNQAETVGHYQRFVEAHNTYRFITKENGDFVPKIEEIPTEFKLKAHKK